MNEELIEKCRLTDEEMFKLTFNCSRHVSAQKAGEFPKRIADAQLAKAIPLISAPLKEESEARREIINRLTARCEQLIKESAEARKQFIEEIKPLLNASVGDMMDGLTRIYRNLTATYLPAKKGCTFKGSCGNRLADEYCSAFSCSWQALKEGGEEATNDG